MTIPAVTVGGLFEARPESVGLPLELLAGRRGLDRPITNPYIQKTGLALAGFHEYLRPGRVLVLGESEIRYLEALAPHDRMNALATAFSHDIPCVMITGGWEPPAEMIAAADRYNMPLLRTAVATPLAIAKITSIANARTG